MNKCTRLLRKRKRRVGTGLKFIMLGFGYEEKNK